MNNYVLETFEQNNVTHKKYIFLNKKMHELKNYVSNKKIYF